MDFKYCVIYEPNMEDYLESIDDDNKMTLLVRKLSIQHLNFLILRDIGTKFGLDHTTISKRLSKNSITYLPKIFGLQNYLRSKLLL